MAKAETDVMSKYAWICSDCAAKAGWKFGNGYVVGSILDKCPGCGRHLWLVPTEDYRVYGFKVGTGSKGHV